MKSPLRPLRLLNSRIVDAMRRGDPVPVYVQGESRYGLAEVVVIGQPGIGRPGCRCCGSPLDRGTAALRVRSAQFASPRNSRNATWAYIHRADCMADGFIQTRGYQGRAPGVVRFRTHDRTCVGWEQEARFDLSDGYAHMNVHLDNVMWESAWLQQLEREASGEQPYQGDTQLRGGTTSNSTQEA